MIFEKLVKKAFQKRLYSRQEITGDVFLYSHTDFEGLRREPFDFLSKRGHALVGDIYYYDGYTDGRIIVFDHGLGAGHRQYMREIELLCRHGFRVVTYDHTGCARSGGETTYGFAQSLSDLDDCISAIGRDERLKDNSIAVVGHSWGGYAALNISALHQGITHLVVLSGFISVRVMVEQYFSGVLSLYRKGIMRLERESNPDFVDYDARSVIAASSAKALLIYSDDDTFVSRRFHYDALASALDGKAGVTLVLKEKRGHNPNYSNDALVYKNSYLCAVKARRKMGEAAEPVDVFNSKWDFSRVTAQDPDVWELIFSHLDS